MISDVQTGGRRPNHGVTADQRLIQNRPFDLSMSEHDTSANDGARNRGVGFDRRVRSDDRLHHSCAGPDVDGFDHDAVLDLAGMRPVTFLLQNEDRKSTRLNSSHVKISYAVF